MSRNKLIFSDSDKNVELYVYDKGVSVEIYSDNECKGNLLLTLGELLNLKNLIDRFLGSKKDGEM